jgi:hypothetical protein
MKDINKLIEKYFEAETTPAEEIIIRDYINSTADLPEEHLVLREMFSYNTSERNQELPADFDSKIMANIHLKSKKKVNKSFYWFSAVAASLLIAFSVYMGFNDGGIFTGKSSTTASAEEVEEAYNEAMNALLLISDNLNRGLAKMEPIEKVTTNVEKIELISKFYEYQNKIFTTSKGS